MNTDIEKLAELLKSFGLPILDDYKKHKSISFDGPEFRDDMLHHNHPLVTGYSGCECEFEFNEDGSFKCIGVWEG